MDDILATMIQDGQNVLKADEGSKRVSECDPADLLSALKRVREDEEYGELLRHNLIDELRQRRMPWAVIAQVSGMNERTLRRNYGVPFVMADYVDGPQ
jgi:hypothetical protein